MIGEHKGTLVSPHAFWPIRWYDSHRRNGRCANCFLPKDQHPTTGYVRARPLGDKSAAVSHNVVTTATFLAGKRISESVKEWGPDGIS